MALSSKSASFLKALLVHYHPSDSGELVHFLSSSSQEVFRKAPQPHFFDFFAFFSSLKWTSEIHYSWFLAPMQNYPASTQAIFIQLFSRDQQKKLLEKLAIPVSQEPISKWMHPFLSYQLKKEVFDKEVLEVFELPFSELNDLLRLSKSELVHLIDLLGIHDLAADLRQVVDRALLGKIHGALTQEQLHFLHYCLKQPLRWIPPKLNISGWDGDKKTLNLILHQRGLIRLGKALVNEHPSLRWHVNHRLDTGRASILNRVIAGKQEPALIPYFKSQVLHLVRRYQR